jgi:cytochrome c peroxidase
MILRPFAGFAVVACTAIAAGTLAAAGSGAAAAQREANLLAFDNPTGQARTFVVSGAIDDDNPFFRELGTNGRACVSCHQPSTAWTITPANVQARFDASQGADPIFRNNDGSNCEGVITRTPAEARAAYSLLLSRGLIRVGLDVPARAEFTIERVDDPYGCGGTTTDGSFYRRPLPSTNLRFLSAVMWDGRESSPSTTILQDLGHQANDATRGHAQALRDLTADEIDRIVAFETGLITAQALDDRAGSLRAQGAAGGPVPLSQQRFFIGINDPVNLNPSGAAFDANVFTIFNAWTALEGSPSDPLTEARMAVARGQQIFNTRTFTITGVGGLNGETFPSGVTVPQSFRGTCTICHDTPNAGNHSVKAPLDIGLSDPAIASYLPVYTLRNLRTHDRVRTTDPGRAMITGKWRDIGKFKGPILRALAARAPYFHNGAATTLDDVVTFYDTRFGLGLTAQERADLVVFLLSL